MRVRYVLRFVAGVCGVLMLVACGGSGDNPNEEPPGNTYSGCVSPADCGNVIIAMTDADGDFLSYIVDVQSLTLKRANGETVETLPLITRIDFAQMADLSEFVTSATVPDGAYVEGRLRLDYTNAAVTVESDGQPVAARVVGMDGNPLGIVDVRVVLDERNHLTVAPGRPSMLTLDFDLAASNIVDLTTAPATVIATPSLVATLEPAEQQALRLRGPLLSVDTLSRSYVIDVRPFNLHSARLGQVTVHTDASTAFEVNGASLTGDSGLQALAAAAVGTQTTAFGTLSQTWHRFDAQTVYAGTSVPGAGVDAVLGTVLSRTGDELIVRGGTIVHKDQDSADFVRDAIKVRVGPATRVFKDGVRPSAELGSTAVSVGQRIQAFGGLRQEAGEWVLDATQGRVRMHLTHLLGSVKQVSEGVLTLDLAAIDGRKVSAFDFAGTAGSADQDTDPINYEVSSGLRGNQRMTSGQSARVFGFVMPFGAAPPDFEGWTVVDSRGAGSSLLVGWGHKGTSAPFSTADQTGLILNLQNPQIAHPHYIRSGWRFTDLQTLPGAPQIVPATDRAVFVIVADHSCLTFHDFGEFVAGLEQRVGTAGTMRSLTVHGSYDDRSNIFTAQSVVAVL